MTTKLNNKNVLISGASIAGPALAYWLQRYGFTVTLIEEAPVLRLGGYKIDIRGKACEVVQKMGLYPSVKKHKAPMATATFVNDAGQKIIEMPADYLAMREGDDVELLRGDLSRILYEATYNNCEYIFNDSIKTINQTTDGVDIEFDSGVSRRFDLVVGADGIHSNVRTLAFGNSARYSHDLGSYYYAIYTMANYLNLDRHEMFYSKINKLVNVYSTNNNQDAKVMFIFRCPGLNFDRKNITQQKTIVNDVYAEDAWEVPKLLNEMNTAPDFYFDKIKQTKMNEWSNERVVLLGDAAYSPSLVSGQGSSMALIGAYILAGELFASGGDYQIAYKNYANEMRNFVKENQKLGETIMQQIVPKQNSLVYRFILKLMSYCFSSNYSIERLRKQIRHAANCINLKDYATTNR